MQKQPYLTSDGQEIQKDDFNRTASAAAHADDVALAAVTRIAAASPRLRAILPQSQSVNTVAGQAGGVSVNEFWAFLGPVTGSPTDPTDIRSAVFTGGSLALAAQSAGVGTFRIDLVYATLFVDQDMAPETRWKRDPVTGVMSSPSIATQKQSYVTVSVQAGTASATPAFPAIPSDPPGGYNIPLAYVVLPNGFGALSTVIDAWILDVSVTTSRGLVPASSMRTPTAYSFATTAKTKHFMAGGTVGDKRTHFAIDTSSGSFNGVVLDNTVDWRRRTFRITSQTAGPGTDFSWSTSNSGALPALSNTSTVTMSNSFLITPGVNRTIWTLTNGGGTVALYVDATTGFLVLSVTGSPSLAAYFMVEASEQFMNT